MAEMDQEELVIGYMTDEELEEVLSIERTAFSEPWTETLFRRELSLPLSHCRTAVTTKGETVGYSVFWIVADEVHLHHIAVRKDWQRKGVASALMADMVKQARKKEARFATLEVRPGNKAAVKLYDRFGFTVRGVRYHYYIDTGEDALVMVADLEGRDGT